MLTGIIFALMLTCFAQKIEATGPAGTPHQFYGTVVSNGRVVGAGYTVTAIINGRQVAATTTDAHGQWGYSPLFVVTAPSSSNIEFYVNGVLAGTAAGCISTNRLDLVCNLTPVSPGGTGAETVTTGTVSSGGTITFFIGPQPPGSGPDKSTPAVAAPPVTSIAVVDMRVSPREVEGGSDVTIAVELLNKGNISFSGGIVLKINDVVEQQKNVTLVAGEAKTVNFEVNRNKPGNYVATVDDYSVDFRVKETGAFNISQSQTAPAVPAQQSDVPVDSQQGPAVDDYKLLPDNPVLALAVLVIGAILAIYLISLIIRHGSSRY